MILLVGLKLNFVKLVITDTIGCIHKKLAIANLANSQAIAQQI